MTTKAAVNLDSPATKRDILSLRSEIKNDLLGFATKDDLKNFATKDDLKKFATKEDLKKFATKDDLKNFATKEDLKKFATKEELKRYATQASLNEVKYDIELILKTMNTSFERLENLIVKSVADIRDDLNGTNIRVNNNTRRIDLLAEDVGHIEKRVSALEEKIA